ncbi:MAG: hypothetical protein IJY62_03215 [Clostridia bacterium]|nr:hypothetical protein [Clostridia bacterium]
MKRMKKFTAFFLTVLTLFCISLVFVGCEKKSEEPKNKKYDVSIRIECDDGWAHIFPPEETEFRVERAYDGKEHKYFVKAYQLVDHPQYAGEWFNPSGSGANVFQIYYLYTDANGKQDGTQRRVKEKGEYIITVNASDTSNLWNFREAYLYLTIK